MLIGTMGTPASSASMNDPPLNRPTVPSTLRVPSGNTMSECRSPTSRAIFFTTAAPGFDRSRRR